MCCRTILNLKKNLSNWCGLALYKLNKLQFEDSQLVPDDNVKNDPDIKLEDENSYSDNKVRSSNT